MRLPEGCSGTATRLALGFLPVSLVLGWSTAQGQQILVPSTPDYGKIPTVDQAAASPISSLPAAVLGDLFALQSVPLRSGQAQFHPHFGYQFQYGDGIFLNPGNQQTTALNTISPGLFCQIGQNWFADFTLGINLYSNPDFRDYLGYTLAIGGQIPFEEWTVHLGCTSSLSDQSQFETATQTKQINNSFVASGSRRFGSRYSLELSASQVTQLTEQFNNQWTWSTLDWLNYQWTPKTSVGVGVGAGYNLIDPGIDSVFQQLQGRVSWLPGPKLSFQLSGGVQFQEFLDPNAADTGIFPLYSAAIVWQPVVPTSLSLTAGHTVGNSYYNNQFSQNTSVGIGLNQRLFEHFNLSIGPSYNFTKYQSTFGSLGTVQDNNYFSLYAGLSTTLFKKLAAAVFYRFNDQQSTDAQFSANGSIVGFSLNYRY